MERKLTKEEIDRLLKEYKNNPIVQGWALDGYSDREIAEFIRYIL